MVRQSIVVRTERIVRTVRPDTQTVDNLGREHTITSATARYRSAGVVEFTYRVRGDRRARRVVARRYADYEGWRIALDTPTGHAGNDLLLSYVAETMIGLADEDGAIIRTQDDLSAAGVTLPAN